MGSLATMKNCKDKSSLEYKDNYEGDCDDDDDYECEAHKSKDFSSHWNPTHKTTLVKSTEQQHMDTGSSKTSTVGSSEGPRPHNLELPYKLKSSKNIARDRRDKNVLKRRTTDKTGNLKGKYTFREIQQPTIVITIKLAFPLNPLNPPETLWFRYLYAFRIIDELKSL